MYNIKSTIKKYKKYFTFLITLILEFSKYESKSKEIDFESYTRGNDNEFYNFNVFNIALWHQIPLLFQSILYKLSLLYWDSFSLNSLMTINSDDILYCQHVILYIPYQFFAPHTYHLEIGHLDFFMKLWNKLNSITVWNT